MIMNILIRITYAFSFVAMFGIGSVASASYCHSNDSYTSYYCSWDDGSWRACSSQDGKEIGAGSCHLYCVGQDADGNEEIIDWPNLCDDQLAESN
jgi:hypothetical protein